MLKRQTLSWNVEHSEMTLMILAAKHEEIWIESETTHIDMDELWLFYVLYVNTRVIGIWLNVFKTQYHKYRSNTTVTLFTGSCLVADIQAKWVLTVNHRLYAMHTAVFSVSVTKPDH